MTQDTHRDTANPLDLIAHHGDLGQGPVNALLDRRDPRTTWCLADNCNLSAEVRDLVLEAILDGRDVGCGEDPRVAMARQPELTGAQRFRLGRAPGLPAKALAELAAGGPGDGVEEVVLHHLAAVRARLDRAGADGVGGRQAELAIIAKEGPDPVAVAVAVGAGWDHLRATVLGLVGEVSGVLACLDVDPSVVDVPELVAGAPFKPASFTQGMAGLLRWPAAAEVLEPRNVDGLACLAAVAADREVHLRALRESWKRLEANRVTDAQRLAESLATNPAVRPAEAQELVRLRDVLQDGYLDDWYPVPGDGMRVDQMVGSADHVRVLRVVANRPRLSHRGVWSAAAVALATRSDRVRAAAVAAVRDNRREGPDRTTIAWIAGRLGLQVKDLLPEPSPTGRSRVDRPVALRPSDEARRDADELQYLMGMDYDVWSTLAVLCESTNGRDVHDLAHVAMGIVGVSVMAGGLR